MSVLRSCAQQRLRLVPAVVILCILLFNGVALAQDDPKALAKEINTELRNSQKMMFNGKLEESLSHLEKAAELLEKLKTLDPNFNQLKTLQNKYDKQKKDLERRLPKDKPAETAPAEEPTPTPTEKPESAPAEKTEPASDAGGADLNTLAKDADKAIKDSQRAMFSGKLEDAQQQLEKATELIGQIKAADPDFGQLKGLEGKYERQQKDLSRRLPKDKPATTTQPTGSKAADTDKLPGGVTNRLKDIDRTLNRGEQILTGDSTASDSWKISALEDTLKNANGVMDDIMKRYGDQIPEGHPEMKAHQDRIAEFQQNVEEFKAAVAAKEQQAADAEAQMEALSSEWLEKLKPYAIGKGRPGHDENKYLIGSGSDNVDEMKHRKMVYNEAKAVFIEYQKVEFPHGKTQELELVEKDLAYALQGFEEGYQETIDRFATKASEELDRAEQWLTDQEAKAQTEGDQKPAYLHRLVMLGIENAIFAIEAITDGEEPRLAEFKSRLAAVEERAQKLRQLGVERTVMIPDAYSGQDIETLKTKAAEFLHKDHPDAKVLRTTVISKNWQEERVWEYTDTSKSAIRYRVTQSVSAQIAGKRGSDVFLYTIHIAKDKLADGSWGDLHGHVMYIDPMLEKNVNK